MASVRMELTAPSMVKIRDKSGKSGCGMPAMLLEIRRDRGLVKPHGHARAEWVKLACVVSWKSRNP